MSRSGLWEREVERAKEREIGERQITWSGWNTMGVKRPIWKKKKIDPPRAWTVWLHSASTLPGTQWEFSKIFRMN